MGKILFRYLFIEQLVPIVVFSLGLGGVFISGRLMQFSLKGLFVSVGTLKDVIQISIYSLPDMMLFILPVATLAGIFFEFVRATGDNELIVLRSSGVCFKQLWPAVLCAAIIPTLIAFYTSIYLVPGANAALRSKLKSPGSKIALALLKEKEFISIIPDYVFFFNHVDTADQSVDGVFVRHTRHGNAKTTIIARHARIFYLSQTGRFVLKLFDGIITSTKQDPGDMETLSFKTYAVPLPHYKLFKNPQKSRKKTDEMTLEELRRSYLATGYKRAALAFHKRLSLPVVCLLLGFAAAPMGTFFYKKNRMTGVVLSFVIFIAYYILLIGGHGLCVDGLIPPFFAVWFPAFMLLILSIWLWFQTDSKLKFNRYLHWKKN